MVDHRWAHDTLPALTHSGDVLNTVNDDDPNTHSLTARPLVLTAGDLDAAVAGLMTPVRREVLKSRPVDIPEVLQWLCRVSGSSC